MEFSIKSGSPEKQRSACVVIGVYESRKLSIAGVQIDRAADGFITEVLKRGDMDGRLGSTLLLQTVPNTLCDRVLLVGLGKEREFHEKAYRDAVRASTTAVSATGAIDMVSYLTELPVKKRDVSWRIEQAAIVTKDALYRFDRLKSKDNEPRRHLKRITLCVNRRGELTEGELGLKIGLATAEGMNLTRDLGNLPGNICTPTYLAEQATELAKRASFDIEVLDKPALEKLGMGSFLSVAKGSRQPPKFITLKYMGGKADDKPVVLVGKGITFDAGGISLKPAAEMDEMKYDMGGAASVLGAFRALEELRPKLNVIGLIPACENLPDGDANKPGDIVTSMSGQTIEILNTDAEGRLILCDALTYAEQFHPKAVVDVATLTGACVIALGHHASGLLANDDSLARQLLAAGEHTHDRAWQLPLWDDYQEQLKSPFADMQNIGGRAGGTITAACFLSRFTKKYSWAHLDIAGTAWKSGKDKGSTGRPVPLLVRYLLNQAEE